jgi:hypothetical protein
MSTLRGKHCAPRADNNKNKSFNTCYSEDDLRTMINRYNEAPRSKKIQVTPQDSSNVLWHMLDEQFNTACDTEYCWLRKLNLQKAGIKAFRPRAPEGGATAWLSTLDIKNVLTQYMDAYPEFLALGAVPMDFCNLNTAVCGLNLKEQKRAGKTKIGIVFNTDPSTRGGQHWICMYIDISAKEPKEWSVNYFDSYGMAPLAQEIKTFLEKLRQQVPGIKFEMNCSDVSGMCTRSVRQQKKNTECGVYCIDFITERLTGTSWSDLLAKNNSDEVVQRKREIFFRPRAWE